MKQWSALLGAELGSWPSVTSRSMFGMRVFYRNGAIFAALPRTRCFDTPNSVAFKMSKKTPRIQRMLAADPRIAGGAAEQHNWIAMELGSGQDLAQALKWFDLAYRTCTSKTNSTR